MWLDERTIGGFTKPNFSSGRTSNFDQQILTSTKQLNQQRLSADGILIPHLRQALIVIGNTFTSMRIFIVLFSLLITACNDRSGDLSAVKSEMTKDVKKLKEEFSSSCKEALMSVDDSLGRQKIQNLCHSIDDANSYLDSVKSEMDKFDGRDVNNVEMVRVKFVYRGVGDSVLNKVKSSMVVAQEASSTKQQLYSIKAVRDSLFDKPNDKLNEELFGMSGSAGASLIIYGLQTELYRVGKMAVHMTPN